MLHYVLRLVINIFELVIIKFDVKKKTFDQSINQNNNFYVYEANFSFKIGENLKILYHAVKRLIQDRYNLLRIDNIAIEDRDTAENLNNNSLYDREEVDQEIAGPFTFSHFGINRTLDRFPEFRRYLGGTIIVGNSQIDNIYHSDSE